MKYYAKNNSTLPMALKMKFYVSKFQRMTQTAASNVQADAFRINDMYDAFVSGTTGVQPTTFDQLMVLYQVYQVYGVLVKAHFNNNDDVSGVAVNCYVSEDNTDISSDTQALAAQIKNSWFTLSAENGGNSTKVYKQYFKIKDFIRNANQENLSGTRTSSPPYPLYWVLNFKNVEAVAKTDVSMQIQLTFYAKLSNPYLQPTS